MVASWSQVTPVRHVTPTPLPAFVDPPQRSVADVWHDAVQVSGTPTIALASDPHVFLEVERPDRARVAAAPTARRSWTSAALDVSQLVMVASAVLLVAAPGHARAAACAFALAYAVLLAGVVADRMRLARRQPEPVEVPPPAATPAPSLSESLEHAREEAGMALLAMPARIHVT